MNMNMDEVRSLEAWKRQIKGEASAEEIKARQVLSGTYVAPACSQEKTLIDFRELDETDAGKFYKETLERRKKSRRVSGGRKRSMKSRAVALKGGCCQKCGYSKCMNALEFHHLDRRQKRYNPYKDELFKKAVAAGCKPFWFNGIFGPAWHCGCEDEAHFCDQQRSMITEKSLE